MYFLSCLFLIFLTPLAANEKLLKEKDVSQNVTNFVYVRYCTLLKDDNKVLQCSNKANDSNKLFDYSYRINDKTEKYLNISDGILRNGHLLTERNSEIKEMWFFIETLKIIEDKAFDNFTSLEVLSIQHTNLRNIDENVLTKKVGSSLKDLTLSNNKLLHISSTAFKFLFHIISLDMDGNHNIGKLINNGIFTESLKNLETLYLRDCNISVLNDDVFVNLKKLDKLLLSKNPITSLPKAINYLRKLEWLEIISSNITSIKYDKTLENKALEVIYAANSNQLVEIDYCAFCNFPNLGRIILGGNSKLSDIHENAFGTYKDLPELYEVLLDGCNITSLPKELLYRRIFINIRAAWTLCAKYEISIPPSQENAYRRILFLVATMGYWMYFFDHQQWYELYEKNCSLKTQAEWAAEGKPNLFIGLIYLVSGVLFELSYFPFMIAMCKKEFFHHTAYKLMFMMGIYDLFILPCNAIIPGIQAIRGQHFCNNPKLYYWAGVISCGGFYGVTTICVILAFDRFLEMSFPKISTYVFGGFKTYLWMLVPIAYQVYIGFQLPHIFNIYIYAMNQDPYHLIAGMENNPKFGFGSFLIFHTWNNALLIFFLIFFYGGLVVVAKIKSRIYKQTAISKVQKQMTFQALCICGEMFFAPLIHIFMNIVQFPVIIEIIAHYSWICLHGDTPIIYFILNKSLRKAVIKMFSPIIKSSTIQHSSQRPRVFSINHSKVEPYISKNTTTNNNSSSEQH